MSQFFRLIKAMFVHFWRNAWLSMITILIIFFASLALHLLFATSAIADATASFLRKKVDIALYLAPNLTVDDATKLQKKITTLNDVDTVVASTPDEVYTEFLKRYERESETVKALKSIDANPFGYVLKVTAKRLEDYPQLYAELSDPHFVPEGVIERKNFDDRSDALSRFSQLEHTVRLGMIGLVAFFALLSLFVVFHTIRMAIYSQREEIGIMKLVGATNWFIRLPFVLEGLFYSIVGVAVAGAIVYPIIQWVDPLIIGAFGSAQASLAQYYQAHAVVIVVSQFGGLAIATMLSAAVAVGRYLKV